MEEIILQTKDRMTKSVEALKGSFQTVRTGRASPVLLDRIEMDYYGSMTPINQLASITSPEARQLLIKPYDRNDIKGIVAAINASDLGINPVSEGDAVRLTIPALNEERRRELCKLCKKYLEECKVAIRNIRRDAMDELKKDKEIPEDLCKKLEVEVQKATDEFCKLAEETYSSKEKEIMTV